jgi:N-acyl-D-aspartate/D-glutamate deacylase
MNGMVGTAGVTAGRAPFDLIIRHGTVVDGSGGPPFAADVGIRGGRIREIGDLSAATTADTIDATGLVVCPGLVDVHSHSDFTLLVDSRARSALAQGVTTELVGNCGHGCSPMRDSPAFAANIFGYDATTRLDWRSTAEYLGRLESAGPAINIASLVPLGNLRMAAMADPEQAATHDELREMARLLEDGLASGAFGLSSGLSYPDSINATPVEIAALARPVAARDGLYAICMRDTGEGAIPSLEEGIDTARTARVRLQLSHAMPEAGSPADMTEQTFERVAAANDDGLDVGFDMHTRPFGEVNLSIALPIWALAGGTSALEARLRDPAERARIKAYPSTLGHYLADPGPEALTLAFVRDPALSGRSLAELTPPGGDPLDTVLDVLLSEVDEVHRPLVLIWMYPEDDVARFFRHPLCSIASDATTLSPDGPLADAVFHGAYTWAAWYLRRMIQERHELSIEEGIRRVTSLPASRIGLADRGVIRPGAWADITVFDLPNTTERGTVEAPNQLAIGARHVLVNGRPAIRDGAFDDARHGAVLRSG